MDYQLIGAQSRTDIHRINLVDGRRQRLLNQARRV